MNYYVYDVFELKWPVTLWGRELTRLAETWEIFSTSVTKDGLYVVVRRLEDVKDI